MQQVVLIFIGGGIGSVIRYIIGLKLNNSVLPYGTLVANIMGSLLIGLVMGYHLKTTKNPLSPNLISFIVIGVFGGFTTFSSFMFENFQLFLKEEYLRFAGYTLGAVLSGLIAVSIGFMIGKLF
jgi:CrcB protein